MASCCEPKEKSGFAFDIILHGSLLAIVAGLAGYVFFPQLGFLHTFAYTIIELAHTMWWGVVLGIVFVGIMDKVPREYFNRLLGRGDTFGGILRATISGLLLDMCSHGILMIGAKLYERGASLSQVMAFLIASPWNSISLTIILIALVGLKWTLVFIAGSLVIAVITGLLFQQLTKKGILPQNPNMTVLEDGFSMRKDLKTRMKSYEPKFSDVADVLQSGWEGSAAILKWLFLGVVIAAALRALVPPDAFAAWFGPTLFGLFMTLIATTVIEVCSEGSTPVAAEILNNANAPGNAFVFLMAGVSIDYTEIMVIRSFAKSWKVALALPLLTVPQVLVLGYILNGL